MEIFLIILFIIILTVPVVLFLRDYYVRRKLLSLTRSKYDSLKALIEKLDGNKEISSAELLTIATNPSLRIALFHTLQGYDRQHLFPEKYFNEEKGAEGYLVNWLEFPTELGNAPDDILLMKIIAMELEIEIHYYVFRFRASAPKWAKQNSWMIGVCGPYNLTSMPYDIPKRVFSRFNSVGLIKPEEEAQWVHENISQ
jgi:hypothetical protein